MWDRDKDVIRVVERDPKKGRIFQDYPAKYYTTQTLKENIVQFTVILLAKFLSKITKSSKKKPEFIQERNSLKMILILYSDA
jgi:hypothetical protein